MSKDQEVNTSNLTNFVPQCISQNFGTLKKSNSCHKGYKTTYPLPSFAAKKRVFSLFNKLFYQLKPLLVGIISRILFSEISSV